MSSRVNEVNGENLQDPPIKNPGYANAETPKPIWIKFCMVVDIPDIVTYTNFGDHRLRGFWVAGGHISPSPTDFHRRPYNTLAHTVRACDQCTKFEVSRLIRYEAMNGGAKYRKWGGLGQLGGTEGHGQCHHLIERI